MVLSWGSCMVFSYKNFLLTLFAGAVLCLCSASVGAQTITAIVRPVCTTAEAQTPADELVGLRSFNGIVTDNAGNVYVTEWNSGDVLKIDPQSDCMQPIGRKANSPRPDHLTTLGASVMYPHGIATDNAGNIYVAQYHGCVVRKISPDGNAAIIAGRSICRFGGDNGPATAAMLGSPNDIAIDAAGNVYVTDELNHVVRKVTADGFITTVAGTPEIKGYSGNGGPAVLAKLNRPWGIAVNKEGHIFIADTKNHVVRKVDGEGIISNYAGNGNKGYSGDNGPASAATLNEPMGIALDGEGNLYIADEHNNVVRMVTAKGIITTFAGVAGAGDARDGMAATMAKLTNPRDVAVDDNGVVYIIDYNNDLMRRIHVIGARNGEQTGVKVSVAESSERYIQIENCTYATVAIIDSTNKVVSEQAVSGNTFRIDISMLAPGNYTLDFKKKGSNKLVHFSVSE